MLFLLLQEILSLKYKISFTVELNAAKQVIRPMVCKYLAKMKEKRKILTQFVFNLLILFLLVINGSNVNAAISGKSLFC